MHRWQHNGWANGQPLLDGIGDVIDIGADRITALSIVVKSARS